MSHGIERVSARREQKEGAASLDTNKSVTSSDLARAREIAFFGLGFWAGHEGVLDEATWQAACQEVARGTLSLDKLANRIALALRAVRDEAWQGAEAMREKAVDCAKSSFSDPTWEPAMRNAAGSIACKIRALPLPEPPT